jgi:hypothetical protein
VKLPVEQQIPVVPKQIMHKANMWAKPVLRATQMLESWCPESAQIVTSAKSKPGVARSMALSSTLKDACAGAIPALARDEGESGH